MHEKWTRNIQFESRSKLVTTKCRLKIPQNKIQKNARFSSQKTKKLFVCEAKPAVPPPPPPHPPPPSASSSCTSPLSPSSVLFLLYPSPSRHSPFLSRCFSVLLLSMCSVFPFFCMFQFNLWLILLPLSLCECFFQFLSVVWFLLSFASSSSFLPSISWGGGGGLSTTTPLWLLACLQNPFH